MSALEPRNTTCQAHRLATPVPPTPHATNNPDPLSKSLYGPVSISAMHNNPTLTRTSSSGSGRTRGYNNRASQRRYQLTYDKIEKDSIMEFCHTFKCWALLRLPNDDTHEYVLSVPATDSLASRLAPSRLRLRPKGRI